ncbi:SRPBCC family protein [Saccharopolyspora shandongensis]|uniref:SRPBCC family protein n=1 Tax=Saccharopolyspora shandongensis TaxID=418495 RepID=UPI00341C8A04
MKLQHQTEVGASAEDVWTFLQDTRAVAQCLPGAELVNELGDDRYEGVLRVAIGPLKMNYAGDVLVVERDAEAHRMALNATGRDKRGSGAVQANVRLQVTSADAGSRIEVVSDVDLSGRIASLGRGVRDVSNRMFVQFADQLSNRIEHPEPDTGATAPAPTPLPSGRSADTMPATTTAPARQAPRPAMRRRRARSRSCRSCGRSPENGSPTSWRN